jgi:hypothetical protein
MTNKSDALVFLVLVLCIGCGQRGKEGLNEPALIKDTLIAEKVGTGIPLTYSTIKRGGRIGYRSIQGKDLDFYDVQHVRKWFVEEADAFPLSEDKVELTRVVRPLCGHNNSSSTVEYMATLVGEDLPSGWRKIFYLVFYEKNRTYAVLPLDSPSKIYLDADTTDCMVGGYEDIRGWGFYNIYKKNKDGSFTSVFSTSDFCGFGVYVSKHIDDCVGYSPKKLRLSNKDINGDGLLDVSFVGKVLKYCKEGQDRLETTNKPLEEREVSIDFLYDTTTSQWVLRDSSVCDLIY